MFAATSALIPVPQNGASVSYKAASCTTCKVVVPASAPTTTRPEYITFPPSCSMEPSYRYSAAASSMLNGEFSVMMLSVARADGVTLVMSSRSSPDPCAWSAKSCNQRWNASTVYFVEPDAWRISPLADTVKSSPIAIEFPHSKMLLYYSPCFLS
jgi:hypothetical protein